MARDSVLPLNTAGKIIYFLGAQLLHTIIIFTPTTIESLVERHSSSIILNIVQCWLVTTDWAKSATACFYSAPCYSGTSENNKMPFCGRKALFPLDRQSPCT
jgi:hypothetical protein